MSQNIGFLNVEGELAAKVIRKDGSHRDIDLGTAPLDPKLQAFKIHETLSVMKRMWAQLRASRIIPLSLTFAAFAQMMLSGDPQAVQLALVTTAGVNYLAADFLSASSARINAFNYHDSGTGTTAAAIGDTTLQTQAGPTTRATGTQSNPVAGTYRSVGTITYAGTLAITEWGLFSQAAQGGTLWDRRVFSAINVVNLDSIQFTYSLVVNAGGT